MAVNDVAGLSSLVDPAAFAALTCRFKRPHEDAAIVDAWSSAYGGIATDYEPRERRASKMARRMAMPCALRGLLWFKLSGGEHRHLADPRSYHKAFQGRGVGLLEAGEVVSACLNLFSTGWPLPHAVACSRVRSGPLHSGDGRHSRR